MQKLKASIKKDLILLLKDRVGLLLMFLLPIVLVVLISALQNNTYKLLNEHQLSILVINQDEEKNARDLVDALNQVGMFTVNLKNADSGTDIASEMKSSDVLISLVIPKGFSDELVNNANYSSEIVINTLGLQEAEVNNRLDTKLELDLYFNPAIQEAFRFSSIKAIESALKLVESQWLIRQLYVSLTGETISPEEEAKILGQKGIGVKSISISESGLVPVPNTSQHNVPAWTIFAMFFMVTSMGSNLVKERISGTILRHRTIPGSFGFLMLSKQIVYCIVALLQVAVIFSIGHYIFPYLGLPSLHIPNVGALLVVSFICGLCAISYALCIGLYAKTLEQANGFGAVSVVILAALGGILVPAFAMPESFQTFMVLSPLYWCLQAYYSLFLENLTLVQVVPRLWPILIIIVFLQAVAIFKMKRA